MLDIRESEFSNGNIYNIHVRNLLNKTSYLRYAILQMFFKLVILFYISFSLMFQKYFVVYIAIHIINFECDKKQKKILKNSIQFHWRPYFRAWKPIITYLKKTCSSTGNLGSRFVNPNFPCSYSYVLKPMKMLLSSINVVHLTSMLRRLKRQ